MRTFLALAPLLSVPLFVDPSPSAQAPDWPFAAPNAGLSIPASNQSDSSGWNMDRLLLEYGELTGTSFVWTAETRSILAGTPVPVEQAVEVPAANVHKIVETLVFQTGFVLSLANEYEPLLVTVHSIHSGRRNAQPFIVDRDDLDRWNDHPAHLIQTVLTLNHTDVRTLTNSMRAMLTDANIQSIIPVGNTHSMILTGPAASVTRLAGLLHQINDEARAFWEMQGNEQVDEATSTEEER